MGDLNIRDQLIKAEQRALKSIADWTQLTHQNTAVDHYNAVLSLREQAYATACAVRRTWEACELRASKENQSGSRVMNTGHNPTHDVLIAESEAVADVVLEAIRKPHEKEDPKLDKSAPSCWSCGASPRADTVAFLVHRGAERERKALAELTLNTTRKFYVLARVNVGHHDEREEYTEASWSELAELIQRGAQRERQAVIDWCRGALKENANAQEFAHDIERGVHCLQTPGGVGIGR